MGKMIFGVTAYDLKRMSDYHNSFACKVNNVFKTMEERAKEGRYACTILNPFTKEEEEDFFEMMEDAGYHIEWKTDTKLFSPTGIIYISWRDV